MLASTNLPRGEETRPANLALRVSDLSFAYPDGQMAINRVSLQVVPGEKVALVGPNGAGKSTLLLHLNGILVGQKGSIQVGELNVNPRSLRQVRSRVGMVFQSPDDQLFSPTVFDDVVFGPLYQGLSESEARARVEQALCAVGMQAYAKRVSHHLSVGEKKRIAIATVLSMDPELLALDEPTAGLDPRARRGLIRLLGSLPQTLVVATHDLAMVREILPRTIIMDQGFIVADGPTATLLQDQELLEAHGLEI